MGSELRCGEESGHDQIWALEKRGPGLQNRLDSLGLEGDKTDADKTDHVLV